jgi:holo-[acyl-carrier protein] synthase
MKNLYTGVDLIEISRLAQLAERIRQRFYQRVFTPAELLESNDRLESLAGKFAAKEAVAKALGCGIGPIHWQDIEIQKNNQGQPELFLYGPALAKANEFRITSWSISISHTRIYAVAFAVALSEVKP